MVFEPIFDRENDELQFWLDELKRLRYTYELLDSELRSWFERDTRVLRAHYSTWIEGNTLREEEVDELMDPKGKETPTVDEREVVNYIGALRWIDEFSRDGRRRIDEAVIRHLHKLIFGGIDRTLTAGEYRKGQNYVRGPATRKRIYTPPNAGDVPALMHDFSVWLQEEQEQGEHLSLVAGVAHLELVAIHPFWDGNGRVARALSTLIIECGKHVFDNLVVLDRYFGLSLRDYYDQIAQAVGEEYERGHDITAWLVYFVKGVQREAQFVHDRMVDISLAREQLRDRLKEGGLKERQADGLAYCVVRDRLRPKDYQRITGVSPAVASQDLRELEDRELLLSQGQTRNRVYVLHPNLEVEIEEGKEKRAREEPT